MLTVRTSRILVPVLRFQQARPLLRLAEALLKAEAKQVVLAGLVGVSEDQPLSKGAYRARRRRHDLAKLRVARSDLALTVDPHVRVSYDIVDDLVALVAEHKCDTVVLRLADDGKVLGRAVDAVLSRLSCRVVLVRGRLPETVSNLLLASRGGAHASHAMQIASALGGMFGSEITLVHAAPLYDEETPEKGMQGLRPDLAGGDWVTQEINLRGSVDELAERLRREWRSHQLMVLGTAAALPGQGMLSARARAILDTIPLSAVVVYIPAERDAPAAPAAAPYVVNVDKWFAENTFDADEFDDIAQLVAAKQAQGLSISLALPALNEAETAGEVISTVREALVEAHPLLDEIVLIDGGSTDDTMQIAEDAGATVYFGPDVLADMGHYNGKGEVLWKSLYVTKGDIVAWIDTDITNIHPRFVYGILGPLLVAPRVKYVKGFYRRPLRVGDKLQASGGGRVTELVVRPLFNLFFPELSGLLQPLAGEYAGRREVLTRVPFFSSYAVETGLLIDILDQFGLFAIAQVDLKERIHRNQSLRALSKMSFVIIQALLARLDKHEIVQILGDPSRSMKLVGDDAGRLFLDIEDLTDNERPPMITVPAYRARRQV